MSNSDVVKYVYERLAQGDLPAILANFDREIEFRLAEGHPYSPAGTTWIGADAITKNFFLKSGPEWEGWAMRVDELTEMGDAIVVEGRYAGAVQTDGKANGSPGLPYMEVSRRQDHELPPISRHSPLTGRHARPIGRARGVLVSREERGCSCSRIGTAGGSRWVSSAGG